MLSLLAVLADIASRPSLLRHLLARRRARQFEQIRQAHDQMLARRLQKIFVGRGLTQTRFSIGRSLHVPEVVSVVAGPPVGLNIRILPGQMPDDFAAHAPAIAYLWGSIIGILGATCGFTVFD